MAAIIDRLDHALEGVTEGKSSDFCPEDVCSFCITGTTPRYQGIYRCITCIKARRKQSLGTKDTASCICIGCSKICHRGHKVELVGYSNGFCDCGATGCNLRVDTSSKYSVPCTSTKSNFCLINDRLPFSAHQIGGMASRSVGDSNSSDSSLDLNAVFSGLREECMSIVCESKETFWVGADWKLSNEDGSSSSGISNSKCRCQLEDLALMVFRYHTEHAQLTFSSSSSSTVPMPSQTVAGAEWWIQIKNLETGQVKNSSVGSSSSASAVTLANKDPTIELHYDKDEGVAEDWGVGVYPNLSTVTYLSASTPSTKYLPQQPTIVYSNTTEDEVGNPIHDCYISFPKIGKHVCFDGSLLHGAPSNKTLAQWEWEFNGCDESEAVAVRNPESNSALVSVSSTDIDNTKERYRFTFLVNIWLDHHPSAVLPLPDSILNRIQQTTLDSATQSSTPIAELVKVNPVDPAALVHISVTDDEALKPDTYDLPSDDDEKEDQDNDDEEEEEGAGIMERIRENYQVLYIPFIPPPDLNEKEVEDEEEEEDEEDSECGLSLRMILPPVPNNNSNSVSDRMQHDCFHIRYEDECASVLEYI